PRGPARRAARRGDAAHRPPGPGAADGPHRAASPDRSGEALCHTPRRRSQHAASLDLARLAAGGLAGPSGDVAAVEADAEADTGAVSAADDHHDPAAAGADADDSRFDARHPDRVGTADDDDAGDGDGPAAGDAA